MVQQDAQNTELTPNTIVKDEESGKLLIVHSIHTEHPDEYRVDWDWNMNPITVADYESNAEYIGAEDESQRTIGAVYVDSIPKEVPWDDISQGDIQKVVDEWNMKVFYFPENRLTLA